MRARLGTGVWLVVFAATLAGCSSVIPARGVLRRGELPAVGYGAYGYVIFTHRPLVSVGSRAQAFCEVYMAGLESAAEYQGLPRASVMPTYWVLSRGAGSTRNCNRLVSEYDYARATVMASAVDALGAQGPLLVAWGTPFERAAGQSALVFDLSRLPPQEFPDALAVWRDRITRSPDTWQNGFQIERIRLELKGFLLEQTPGVLAVVSWAFPHGLGGAKSTE